MSNEGGDRLLLWSTADQREPVADSPIQGQSHSISFSRDMAAGSAAKSEASGVISLWDLRNPSKAPVKLSERSQSDYKSLEFSPDSRWLVSGTWGGDVSMWDVSGDNPATTPRHRCQQGAGVRLRPAFSPDGHYVATAANEWKARARLWDLTSPEPCADPLLLDPHSPSIRAPTRGTRSSSAPTPVGPQRRAWIASAGCGTSSRVPRRNWSPRYPSTTALF